MSNVFSSVQLALSGFSQLELVHRRNSQESAGDIKKDQMNVLNGELSFWFFDKEVFQFSWEGLVSGNELLYMFWLLFLNEHELHIFDQCQSKSQFFEYLLLLSELLIVFQGDGAHHKIEVVVAYLSEIQLSQLEKIEVLQYLVHYLLLLLLIQLLIYFEQQWIALDALLEIFKYLISYLVF